MRDTLRDPQPGDRFVLTGPAKGFFSYKRSAGRIATCVWRSANHVTIEVWERSSDTIQLATVRLSTLAKIARKGER